MFITAIELKINLDKYFMFAETEDIYITCSRKVATKLSGGYITSFYSLAMAFIFSIHFFVRNIGNK